MGMFGFDDRFVLYDVTPVENQFILNCLPTADAAQLRVYLYGLMQCRHPAADMSVEQMAHDLNLTPEEVLAAFRHWEFHRLVQRVSDKPPAYRFVSMAERAALGQEPESDQSYIRFAEALASCFGERRLHGQENSLAFEWVEVLGLPQDVVLVMVRHLIRVRGQNFSFAATGQKTAAMLADAHVQTVEEALILLAVDEKAQNTARAVLRQLGMSRRNPSVDEINLCKKWVGEWGFDQEAILAACAATPSAHTPTFAYLDGILLRLHEQGAQVEHGADMRAHLEAEQAEEEAIRRVLRILRAGEVVNQGTRAVYAQMRALYPDAIIQLAAEECARGSGKLDDVQAMLESWHEKGLETEAEVRAYVAGFNSQTALLKEIYARSGARGRVSKTDRERLTRWQTDWGFSTEMLLACAAYAAGTERPMAYLDSLLETYHRLGITTPAQAGQERESRRRGQGGGQSRLTPAQQYEQRDYTGEDAAAMPEWLLQRWKETYGDAK